MKWFEQQQKNKPQSNALSNGLVLAMASGMHIAFGLMNFLIDTQEWTRGLHPTSVLFVICAWFLSVPVGLLIGRFMLIKFEKKWIGFVAVGLYATSGILFISAPHLRAIILTGRCLAGVGHGVIYLTTIVHGSEILVNNNRGMVMAAISLNMAILATVIVSLNMSLEDASTIDPNRVLGILQLSIAALAGLLTHFLTYESPVYLLQRNRDSEAKSVMQKLRNETTDTHELLADLHDLKTLVAEEEVFITSIFQHGNMRPLVTIALLRILNVLTFNYPLNYVRVLLSIPALTISTQSIIMSMRVIVGALTLLTFDCVPRRVYFFVSGFESFATLALLTILYQIDAGMGMWTFAGVVLVYDSMVAVAIPQLTDIYSAEAFPLSKKFDSLCAVKLVENLLQAALVMSMVDMGPGRGTVLAILYTFTILIGVVVVLLVFRLPETRNKSIRETRDLFRGNVRNLTL